MLIPIFDFCRPSPRKSNWSRCYEENRPSKKLVHMIGFRAARHRSGQNGAVIAPRRIAIPSRETSRCLWKLNTSDRLAGASTYSKHNSNDSWEVSGDSLEYSRQNAPKSALLTCAWYDSFPIGNPIVSDRCEKHRKSRGFLWFRGS